MSLDKLTLHAQLSNLAKNATSLDAAIVEKTKAIEAAVVDLERTRGARQYHEMIVQQINLILAEIEKEEKANAVPPA